MRLVCAGVANGISHTTSGEPTTSTVVLDRVTGQPIALFGVGGGVVRSIMSLFSGDLRRFPPCVVILSPSVMTFVDLPVYLRLMTLQNVRVTVMAPASVLDAVVQYIEDVLAEEDAAVGIAVQRMTQFVDLETDVPVVLPTKLQTTTTLSSSGSPSRSGASMGPAGSSSGLLSAHGGSAAKDIQSAFDDVVLSQWLLFLQSSKSPVREDHFLFNAVLVHRRVVIDGANKHKDAVAAALSTAMSAAGMLHAADGVVKEDTTTMLAVVGHLPTSSTSSTSTEDETTELQTASPPVVPPHDTSAMMFLMQCDAIVTSIQDEVLIRSACSVASAAAAELAAATARSSSSSARRSNQGTPPPSHLTTLGDEAPPPLGSPAAINKNAAHEPSIILTRFAAHEPPLTFHPKTFVAQRGVEYRISPHEGVVQLGALLGHQQKNNRASKKSLSLASHVLSSSSPLGAKLVEEDLQDSDADEHDNLRGPNHHAGGGGGSQNVEGRDEYRLTGVDAHAIGALRQEQQRKRATTQAAAATSHHLSSELENHNNASGSPPATNAFAMSLRAEHYDAEMSQLAEMRRQLGVPYVADSAVPVNWGSMGGAAQPHNNHRGIGRHTAARSTARGQHDNAAGHIMVQSSSSPHNSRSVGVGSHNSPPSSSSLRHPIVGTGGGGAGPGGLVKPPPASRHYRCTFLHDVHSLSFEHHHSHHSRSGGTLYEYNLLHPGDPLQCAPLNMDTACQGHTAVLQQYLQSSTLQTTPHTPHHRQLQLLCLQVLRAIQFSVGMLRATQAMIRDEFVSVDVLQPAVVDGSWLFHLQELLNEALYAVLVALDAMTTFPSTTHQHNGSASTKQRTSQYTDSNNNSKTIIAAGVATLQRVLHAVHKDSERWVRWSTTDQLPLVDFTPFARAYEEDISSEEGEEGGIEFHIVVEFHQ